MRETTLAMVLPATRVQSAVQSKPQPQIRPDADHTFTLIARARSGDTAAFDQLMRLHERLVLMTALRALNGNMANAQDAAQTVFLRLHQSLGKFRDSGNKSTFPAWLYRITVNVCHDMNRKRQRLAEVELGGVARVAAAADGDAAPDLEHAERQMEAVTAGLQYLGEKERAAIVLRDIEGLDTSAVASILGSSEATVRSQISVGRRKLRKFAEAYMRRQS
jgi:RNA polymerase sigma-70 factor (ECF subfamily)